MEQETKLNELRYEMEREAKIELHEYCGVVEFTREEVDALLNVKIRTKDKFNLKEKSEIITAYIKRLKMCVRWFQDF
ncbi:hypothetical protein QVD17_16375 [Tagetes erecta]|uniref:Uncharacterized protein n=1 Tax=Tagetes erecta TaxID=13708 RepID=A0AAD8NZI5_TARER|nr:hypothetical protein QVD17_16375 [Tagetes erecta]